MRVVDPVGRGVVTLAHVTDAHAAPNGRRTAVLKDRSIEILTDLVDQLRALGVDCVLFGGDNIDNVRDGPNDLAAFLRIVNPLDRWLCIVGNHEAEDGRCGTSRVSKTSFAHAATGHGITPERMYWSEGVGNVRIIGIDTTLAGTQGGYVAPRTMEFLAKELRDAEEDHVVVLGHHLLAAPWAPYRLDEWDRDYLVANRDVVTSLLSSCPKVRAYLCGHHHASRIHRIAGRGASGGFYHILTASPVAYPHAARVLRFEDDALVVSSLRPRLPGVMEQGLEAVLGGRKARRFEMLGTTWKFSEYVAGSADDNDVTLPYTPATTADLIPAAASEARSEP